MFPRSIFVVLTLLIGSISASASAQRIVPSPLLTIDQNRPTVVERIVGQWGDRLVSSNAGIDASQLRQILYGLRSDHLLAASLAGSVEGLRDVVSGALVHSDAAISPVLMHAKALGDTGDDLVYTPVVPCRILDTRNGTIAPYNSVMIGGAAFPVAANLANFAPQGGSATNCNLPSTFQAIAVTLTVLNPNFDAFLAASNSSNFATLTQSVVMDFTANKGLANTAIVPVDGTIKFYLGLPSQVTTHVIADAVGYFKPAVNATTGAFEVAFNGNLALQIKPDATSPIFIAGSNANNVTAGASGAAIGGGGAPGTQITIAPGTVDCTLPPGGPCANRVTDAFGTVGGGIANQAGDAAGSSGDKPFATVGGGQFNVASGGSSVVGGGNSNAASGAASTVSGGVQNTASTAEGTVAGGALNTASGPGASTVSGGFNNTSSGIYATVAGGRINLASGQDSTIGGGKSNTASGTSSAVAGGEQNTAVGSDSFVGGGLQNSANGTVAAVGGGNLTHADGDYSFVGGGVSNAATGKFSTVLGGNQNTASADYTLAWGNRSKAVGTGSFVVSDSTNLNFLIGASNYFGARFTGGFMFATGVDGVGSFLTGCTLPSGGGTFSCTSDRATKTAFANIDSKEVLQRVVDLPITAWRFRGEPATVKHMGPVAQDFRAAFGLGYDDKTIGVQDAQGVALAAIQGLHQLIEQKDRKIAAMERELLAIKEKLNMR